MKRVSQAARTRTPAEVNLDQPIKLRPDVSPTPATPVESVSFVDEIDRIADTIYTCQAALGDCEGQDETARVRTVLLEVHRRIRKLASANGGE